MRIFVVAVALLLGLAGTAEARFIVIVTSGEDIIHIRDVAEPGDAADFQDHKLGYRYDHWGLFGLDLSRSGGQFVVYRGDSLHSYVPVSDSELDAFGGASVPWKYRLPFGWIVIFALVEVVLVTASRRRVGVVFVIAGVMALVALVFVWLGLNPEFVIPLALAGHHVFASLLAIRLQKQIDAHPDARARELRLDEPEEPPPEPERARDLPLPSPPRVETDPFRAPPMPRPIVTERPPERPSTAPIVHDANAEQPKLLR